MATEPETTQPLPPKSNDTTIVQQALGVTPILRTYADQLTPPSWDELLANNDDSLEVLTWRIDAYIYLVNARPDENFAANGGHVYVVLVHSGSAEAHDYTHNNEYQYNVDFRGDYDGATMYPLLQLPVSGSGTSDPSTNSINYPISFQQDMQMFTNNGNETFTFTASYEDNIIVQNGQQLGLVRGSSGVQWGVQLYSIPSSNYNFPFGSLSVFKLSTLQEVTFSANFSVRNASASMDPVAYGSGNDFVVDCRFTPVD
ncbi:hypothetical protein ONZ45_g1635 [Pleurotus djamor]|nr:hypothetical protein ONZ45_g1635 [Pleurotus djamor]